MGRQQQYPSHPADQSTKTQVNWCSQPCDTKGFNNNIHHTQQTKALKHSIQVNWRSQSCDAEGINSNIHHNQNILGNSLTWFSLDDDNFMLTATQWINFLLHLSPLYLLKYSILLSAKLLFLSSFKRQRNSDFYSSFLNLVLLSANFCFFQDLSSREPKHSHPTF